MTSKTPQFDKALDAILRELKPHVRPCRQCGRNFEIFKEDIDFYQMLRVPPPTVCYDCRRQRRLAFANYTTLYHRPCGVPGHAEKIISSTPPVKPFPVYDFTYYWSDTWDPMRYAVPYKESERFIDQFYTLFSRVPQPASTRDPSNVGSDYTLYGVQLKNCYYTFGGLFSENIYYSMWPIESQDCMDILLALNSRLCYESVFVTNCYNCDFAYFSNDCLESKFIYDCRNCSHCFGCVNLRNKKYYFFNEPLTEQEYKERLSKINLGDRNALHEYATKFWSLVKQLPVRSVRNEHSKDVVGNYILNSKRCFRVSYVWRSEDLRYGDFTINMRDSMDFTISSEAERLYEIVVVTRDCFNVKFSLNSRVVGDSEYLIDCRNCTNCFGCVGLRDKKFCILNTQYTESDYWKLVDAIKSALLKDGAYGEFLPFSFSSYVYNGSFAQLMYPLDEEKAKKLGSSWYEPKTELPPDISMVPVREVPADIRLVNDDVTKKAIASEGSGKPFRIVKSELEFYRRKHLPIPALHPSDRLLERFKKVNYFKIQGDKCARCRKEIWSSYDSRAGFKPYCDQCYNAEVV